jgi:hypothetical protein
MIALLWLLIIAGLAALPLTILIGNGGDDR